MKLSDLLKPDPRKKLQKMLKENRYEQFIQEPIDKTIKEEILNSPLNKLHRKNIFITAFFLEEEVIDLDKLYTTDFRDELLNQINLKPDFILPVLQFLKKQNEPLTIKDVNKYPMELQGKLMESIIKLEPEKVLELENKTPELIDLAIKEGFEPLKEDLVKYPELCYSRECMQKMVAQNAENILLDKTKNPALYELIQSKKIMFAESEILQNPELLKYQDIVKHSVYKDSKMLAYVDYLDKELVYSTLEKTNQELYWMAAELLKKENKTFEEQRFLNSLIKSKNDIQSICALLRNNPKIEGKYQIPQEHIFESIKHFYKQLPKNLENLNDHNLGQASMHLASVVSMNNFYDEHFGKEIQELYERKDILLGVAGGSYERNPGQTYQNIADSFFKDGLTYVWTQNGFTLDRVVAMQVKEDGSTLDLADILNYNFGSAKTNILFAVPTNAFYPSDNPVPIWKETEKGIHLDTSFIYGAFEEKNQNAEVYHNPYFGRPLQGKYMYNDTLGIKESIMLGEQIENQIGRQI